MTQGRTIETVTLEELFAEQTNGVLPILADIQHDGIIWTDGSTEQENGHLRLINDTVPVRYNGYKYMPAYFEFTQPQEDGKKVGSTNITVSAIDQRSQEIIRSINDTRPTLVIETFYCKMNGYKQITEETKLQMYYKDEYGEYKETDDFIEGNTYIQQTAYQFSKLNHYEFEMSQANWDNVTAKWTLTYDPVMQVNVPIDAATELRCPAVNTGK